MHALPVILFFSLMAFLSSAAAQSPDALLARALELQGGPEIYDETNGVSVETEGAYDLSARHQGRSLAPDFTAVSERMSVDPAQGRTAYELDWRNYAYSRQHLREIHHSDGAVLYMDLRNGLGGWNTRPQAGPMQQRLLRYDPRRLLAEAAASGALEALEDEGGAPGLRFTAQDGAAFVLRFDPESGVLRSAAHRFSMPVSGDSAMRWEWYGYAEHEELGLVPGRMQTRLNNAVLKDVRMAWSPGVIDDLFTARDGGPLPERPEEDGGAQESYTPYGERAPDVATVADNVHMIRNLRPGFLVPFIEFDDYVAVIDAPSLWYEMQYIPPQSGSPGDDVHALGRKILRAVEETTPGKPVRYLVLTHHHSDHIGGMRPILEAGATVVAGGPAAEQARRQAETVYTLEPSPLTQTPEIITVDGEYTISDGETEVRLYQLPDGNPKADGFLSVHVTGPDLLYVTSFIYPVPERIFPLAESVPLSTWLVNWLDENGLGDTALHYNIHGMGRVQPWQVDYFRPGEPGSD